MLSRSSKTSIQTKFNIKLYCNINSSTSYNILRVERPNFLYNRKTNPTRFQVIRLSNEQIRRTWNTKNMDGMEVVDIKELYHYSSLATFASFCTSEQILHVLYRKFLSFLNFTPTQVITINR
jgi:hypothetical protein